MATFARWVSFIPAAIFVGFATLVEVDNLADWFTSSFPATEPVWPIQYTVADLIWPIIFILVAASVAPAGRTVVAWLFAALACAAAIMAGGSLSLYWLPVVPSAYQKIGLGMTVAGALLGVLFVTLILRTQQGARRTAPA